VQAWVITEQIISSKWRSKIFSKEHKVGLASDGPDPTGLRYYVGFAISRALHDKMYALGYTT